ncbi:ATP-binding cassette domain-containing protein [Sediminibacterium roseum]|uniref:ATP-binding cassette domain-containing protein n=1 Tax=Sediminibacterium roseum TaxID=1978412 RepID=A0ABW9ZUS1_9BACT|nr:ATP-binding cassette domain-containing protein [Sediminibacterium roseum]NCI48606.1 ATP-binding cassette domain-containing protein [Sediminibacterium roseum]
MRYGPGVFLMNIELDHIIPIPLKDRLIQRRSDVWNNTVSFAHGEFVKIKAPSGTGKTTFVHILYNLRHDYEGRISIGQKPLNQVSEDELAEMRQQKISIVFQDLRLFPNLTARENIELKRVLQTPYYPAEKIDEMAEALGVTHILNQRAGLCSYGEQQRVSIVRALIQPFELLVMDEPFSHLDINNTKKAAALIETECRKRNAGFIITDLDEDDNFQYTRKLVL